MCRAVKMGRTGQYWPWGQDIYKGLSGSMVMGRNIIKNLSPNIENDLFS
jgi:hypothetical protein